MGAHERAVEAICDSQEGFYACQYKLNLERSQKTSQKG